MSTDISLYLCGFRSLFHSRLHPELTCPNTDIKGRGRTLPFLELSGHSGSKSKQVCGFAMRLQYLQEINSVNDCLSKLLLHEKRGHNSCSAIEDGTTRLRLRQQPKESTSTTSRFALSELIWTQKKSSKRKIITETQSSISSVLVEYEYTALRPNS